MTSNWRDEYVPSMPWHRSISIGAVDLAPVLNVVLLLVIFSLMATGFIYQPGVQIDIPVVRNPDAIRGRTLTLTITRDERVYVSGTAQPLVLREAILSQLREFKRHHPDGVVILRADSNVRHGFLLSLVEMVREAGLRRIAFGGALGESYQTTATVD
ncbi:biopolymer transporter ExbD [bacterium]|nr:biopolymer transporter ExbD [bacterium]